MNTAQTIADARAIDPRNRCLFRNGDYYQMHREDAEDAHSVLGLTLAGPPDDPTVGFPVASAEAYIKRLILAARRPVMVDASAE